MKCSMQWYITKSCFSPMLAFIGFWQNLYCNVDKIQLITVQMEQCWFTIPFKCLLFSHFHMHHQEGLAINLAVQVERWDLLQQGGEELTPSLVCCSYSFAYSTIKVNLRPKFLLPTAGRSSYRPQEFTPSEVCMHTTCRNGVCFWS